ncbi:MAG: hypothetical protein WA777_18545 [Rhodanobacter sp.]
MSDTPLELLKPGIGNGLEQDHKTTKFRHVGTKGDLTVELHYGDFDTGHGRQAALCIYRRGHEKTGVFVPLSAMWMFAECDALHIMIPPLAAQIYGFVTKQDNFRVLDAILDYIDDLRKSPPDPNLFKDKSLDAFMKSCEDEGLDFSVKVNGKKVIG